MSFQLLLAKLRYRQLARDFLYCGLQIQGKPDIKKIISGVSANQDLIDAQFRFNQCNSFREEDISVFSPSQDID
jgi:hypothetical protein